LIEVVFLPARQWSGRTDIY